MLAAVCVLQVEETTEGIDYTLLKQQEKIFFYDDVILYEDELADNGTAVLSAKIVGTHSSDSTPIWYRPSPAACDGLWVLHTAEVLHESGWGPGPNE